MSLTFNKGRDYYYVHMHMYVRVLLHAHVQCTYVDICIIAGTSKNKCTKVQIPRLLCFLANCHENPETQSRSETGKKSKLPLCNHVECSKTQGVTDKNSNMVMDALKTGF